MIVTKLGARRGAGRVVAAGHLARGADAGVHDNLRNLGLDALDIVNYRVHGRRARARARGRSPSRSTVLADLQQQGLIRHIGLSNVTAAQVAEAQAITDVVCVQNHYNLAHRDDDALIDDLARQGIAYVPFFPLGGFTPLQSSTLSDVAAPARSHADAGRAGLAAAPLAQHPADPRHVVGRPPGENLESAARVLGPVGADGAGPHRRHRRARHRPVRRPFAARNGVPGDQYRPEVPSGRSGCGRRTARRAR